MAPRVLASRLPGASISRDPRANVGCQRTAGPVDRSRRGYAVRRSGEKDPTAATRQQQRSSAGRLTRAASASAGGEGALNTTNFDGDTSLPSSCRAAVYDEASADPSAVRLVDVAVAPPGPGLVVLRAQWASVNPIDALVMAGLLEGAGWALPLPFVMGYDVAGTVVAVGEGVSGLAAGDPVFCVNWGEGSHNVEGGPVGGCLSELVTVRASVLSRLPEGCPADKAAAVALVGSTAYQGVVDKLRVQEGDRVLVLGGAGAVGQLAIQLAKEAGAWVATTCSPRTADFVRAASAPDLIVDYRESNWWEVPELRGVDAVFATVAEETPWTHAKKVLKRPGGRFASISDQECGFDPDGHADEGYPFASFFGLRNSPEHQDKFAADIAAGRLNVVIDSVSDFTDEGLQAALAKQASGTSMGKNLIKF